MPRSIPKYSVPRTEQEFQAAQEQALQETAKRRPLSSALESTGLGLAGSVASSAGNVLGAVGLPGAEQASDYMYGRARGLSDRAQALTPEGMSWENVDGPGSFAKFVGLNAATAPISTAPAIAGALLSRGNPLLGGMIGSGIPLHGETVQRFNEDPTLSGMSEREKLARAGVFTAPQALLEAAVPASLVSGAGARLAKNLAPGAGRVAKGATALAGTSLVEGGTELGQTGIQQYAHSLANPARDTSGDAAERVQAFAAGAAGGAGFGAKAAADAMLDRTPTDASPLDRFRRDMLGDGTPTVERFMNHIRGTPKPDFDARPTPETFAQGPAAVAEQFDQAQTRFTEAVQASDMDEQLKSDALAGDEVAVAQAKRHLTKQYAEENLRGVLASLDGSAERSLDAGAGRPSYDGMADDIAKFDRAAIKSATDGKAMRAIAETIGLDYDSMDDASAIAISRVLEELRPFIRANFKAKDGQVRLPENIVQAFGGWEQAESLMTRLVDETYTDIAERSTARAALSAANKARTGTISAIESVLREFLPVGRHTSSSEHAQALAAILDRGITAQNRAVVDRELYEWGIRPEVHEQLLATAERIVADSGTRMQSQMAGAQVDSETFALHQADDIDRIQGLTNEGAPGRGDSTDVNLALDARIDAAFDGDVTREAPTVLVQPPKMVGEKDGQSRSKTLESNAAAAEARRMQERYPNMDVRIQTLYDAVDGDIERITSSLDEETLDDIYAQGLPNTPDRVASINRQLEAAARDRVAVVATPRPDDLGSMVGDIDFKYMDLMGVADTVFASSAATSSSPSKYTVGKEQTDMWVKLADGVMVPQTQTRAVKPHRDGGNYAEYSGVRTQADGEGGVWLRVSGQKLAELGWERAQNADGRMTPEQAWSAGLSALMTSPFIDPEAGFREAVGERQKLGKRKDIELSDKSVVPGKEVTGWKLKPLDMKGMNLIGGAEPTTTKNVLRDSEQAKTQAKMRPRPTRPSPLVGPVKPGRPERPVRPHDPKNRWTEDISSQGKVANALVKADERLAQITRKLATRVPPGPYTSDGKLVAKPKRFPKGHARQGQLVGRLLTPQERAERALPKASKEDRSEYESAKQAVESLETKLLEFDDSNKVTEGETWVVNDFGEAHVLDRPAQKEITTFGDEQETRPATSTFEKTKRLKKGARQTWKDGKVVETDNVYTDEAQWAPTGTLSETEEMAAAAQAKEAEQEITHDEFGNPRIGVTKDIVGQAKSDRARKEVLAEQAKEAEANKTKAFETWYDGAVEQASREKRKALRAAHDRLMTALAAPNGLVTDDFGTTQLSVESSAAMNGLIQLTGSHGAKQALTQFIEAQERAAAEQGAAVTAVNTRRKVLDALRTLSERVATMNLTEAQSTKLKALRGQIIAATMGANPDFDKARKYYADTLAYLKNLDDATDDIDAALLDAREEDSGAPDSDFVMDMPLNNFKNLNAVVKAVREFLVAQGFDDALSAFDKAVDAAYTLTERVVNEKTGRTAPGAKLNQNALREAVAEARQYIASKLQHSETQSIEPSYESEPEAVAPSAELDARQAWVSKALNAEPEALEAQLDKMSAEQLNAAFDAVEAYAKNPELGADDMGQVARLEDALREALESLEAFEAAKKVEPRGELTEEQLAQAGAIYRDALIRVGRLTDNIQRTKDGRDSNKEAKLQKLNDELSDEQGFVDALIRDFGKDRLETARAKITETKGYGKEGEGLLSSTGSSVGTVHRDIVAKLADMSAGQLKAFAARQRLRAETVKNGTLRGTMLDEADYADSLVIGRESVDDATPADKVTPEQKAEAEAAVKKLIGEVNVQWRKLIKNNPHIAGYFDLYKSGKERIQIALHAMNPLTVAYHESMHAFFDRAGKSDDKDVKAMHEMLSRVVMSPLVARQLAAKFATKPMVLAAMNLDKYATELVPGTKRHDDVVHERMAYYFQLYANGDIQPLSKARSALGKIAAFFRLMVGLLDDSQRFDRVMEAFADGRMSTPSAMASTYKSIEARRVALGKVWDATEPLRNTLEPWFLPAINTLARMESADMDWVRTQFYNESTEFDRNMGLLAAKDMKYNEYVSKWMRSVEGATQEEMAAAHEVLIGAERDVKDQGAVRKTGIKKIDTIVDGTLSMLEELWRYQAAPDVDVRRLVMSDGKPMWVPIGFVTGYFPRAWDFSKIGARRDQFIEVLMRDKYRGDLEHMRSQFPDGDKMSLEQIAGALADQMSSTDTQMLEAPTDPNANKEAVKEDEGNLGYVPWAQHVNVRSLSFIDASDFKDFFNDNLINVMGTYIRQATHKAEYARRFKYDGSRLRERMTAEFRNQTAKAFEKATGEKPKVLADMTKVEREAYLARPEMQAAQEEAKKQLSIVAKSVMAMEGTLGHDISPLLRKAMGGAIVYQNIRLMALTLFANMMDTAGIAARTGEMGDAFRAFKRGMKEIGLQYKGDIAKDEATRLLESIGAVEVSSVLSSFGDLYAGDWMQGTAKKVNDKLFELNGMTAWNRGQRIYAGETALRDIPKLFKQATESGDKQARRQLAELGLRSTDAVLLENGALNVADKKVQEAIVRWVNSSVMRPNAAHRPAKGSDPHWAILYQFKQFTYTFTKVMLKRLVNEYQMGNQASIYKFAALAIPIMVASDISRAVLTHGGDLPAYMEGYGPGDWLWHGAQRSGILGYGQIGVDTAEGGVFGSLLGPSVSQVADLVLDKHDAYTDAVRALPLSTVVRPTLLN